MVKIKIKDLLLKYKRELWGLTIGAIAGWCYWYFEGCASGSCLITSSPVNSTLYGAVMGGLLGSMFKKSKSK